ncbi:hypothetical protein F383_37980 [Gossypium arboreum]|uniref:Uncharacterized protein n=1 Tax=Gossypium arboreum TaxID=29729 RepID=A0A0B0MHB4_GOSAR|nr:hypothetical protein F383_37980 [Gossypium arboreum]
MFYDMLIIFPSMATSNHSNMYL